MDGVVAMDLSTWHGLRARDPRRLALGSAQWGMPYGIANRQGQPSLDEVAALLARARAAGITCIDTARAYGESEAVIGRLASPEAGWRVVTKLAPDVHGEGLGLPEALDRVQRSLAESRAALDRDVLPVLLLHRFAHRHVCGGRVWRVLLAEREAGRIGSLGVSAGTPEEAWAALEDPDIEAIQVATSLLDLRLQRQGFFPRARELGRTVYVRSVFLQGVAHLAPASLPPALRALSEAMDTIRRAARELSVAPRALYLAFVRSLPGVHPVVGCETEAQLAELLEDWSSEAVDAAALVRLVDALPTHDADLVDPSRWPPPDPEAGIAARANQTPGAGVATLPI
jgi:spore coat polysaccharide biosynthesis protein SpsF